MTNFEGIDNLRLAKSEVLLAKGYIRQSYNLPEPTVAEYTLGSQVVDLTQGGSALRGDRKVILLWQNISADEANDIWVLVNDAIGDTNEFWVTVDKGWNGSGPVNSWIDVKGVPRLPQIQMAEGTHNLVASQVILQIDDVTVQNDPASF